VEKVEQRVFVPTSREEQVETSNIKVGNIALVKKDNVPPLRVATGLIKRAIAKLEPSPIAHRCTTVPAALFADRLSPSFLYH